MKNRSAHNKDKNVGWGEQSIARILEIFDAYGIPRGCSAQTEALQECIQLLAPGATVCPIIRQTQDGGFLEVVVVDQTISEILTKQ